MKAIIQLFTGHLEKELTAQLGAHSVATKACAIASMGVSITTFFTQVYNACNNKTTTLTKWVLPTLSLLQVVTCISTLVSLHGSPSFDATKAAEWVFDLLNSLGEHNHSFYDVVLNDMQERNAFDAPGAARIGISLLTLAIISGTSISGVPIRDITSILTLREKTVKLNADLYETITDVIQDLFDYDLKSQAAVTQKLTSLLAQSSRLARTPPVEFVSNMALFQELVETMDAIEKIQSAQLNPEQARTYSSVKSLLNAHFLQLCSVHATLKSVVDEGDRQTTLAFVLEGIPGIGKSELAKYIMREVGKILNYAPDIYNLDPGINSKYYQIYKRQAFGILNEFGALRDTVPMIGYLNSILSSDPVNLEAAELMFKHQSCMLRLVGLTANDPQYRFPNVMTEQANVALITRLEKYIVEDEQFEGRGQPNGHRSPNFTHLTLQLKEHVNTKPTRLDHTTEVRLVPMTVQEVIQRLARRVADEEYRHMTKLLLNSPDMDQTLKTGIQSRITQLGSLFTPVRNANTSFFVARWQGPRNVGKTKNAQSLSRIVKSAFNMETIEITNFSTLPTETTPTLYIIDDVKIDAANVHDYLLWVNATPANSIILHCTNHVVLPARRNRFSLKNVSCVAGVGDTDLTQFSLGDFANTIKNVCFKPSELRYYNLDQDFPCLREAPGCARRLGFVGPIYLNGEDDNTPPNSGICISMTTRGEAFVNCESMCSAPWLEATLIAYKQFVTTTDDFLVVRGEGPQLVPDIHILIRDFNLYKEKVKHPAGYREMVMNPNSPAGHIMIKPGSEQRFLQTTNVSTWVMPSIRDEQDFFQSTLTFLHRLVNAFPDVTVKLTHGDRTLTYVDHTIYDGTAEEEADIFQMENGILHYGGFPIDPTTAANVAVNGLTSGRPLALGAHSIVQWAVFADHIKTNLHNPDFALYKLAYDNATYHRDRMETYRTSPFARWLVTDSLSRNIIAAVLAATVVCGSAYGIYKLLGSKKDNSLKRNYRDDDYEEEDEEEESKYQKDLARGKCKNRDQYIKQQVAVGRSESYLSGWHKRTIDSRYPGYESNAFSSGTFDKATAKKLTQAQLIEQVAHHLDSKKNMVPRSLELSSPTELDALCKKLQHNLIRVTGKLGDCYGICVDTNVIITVKHIVYDQDFVTVLHQPSPSEDPKPYKAKVLATHHKSDLAVLRVVDRHFPMAKDIANYFPAQSSRELWSGDCIFVRPLTTIETHWGCGTFRPNRLPIGDVNDPSFSPSKVIDWTPYHMGVGSQAVKSGDCGMPLVEFIGGTPYIIGINCAKARSGDATFSLLSRYEIFGVSCDQLEPNSVQDHLIPINHVTGKADYPPYNSVFVDIHPFTKWRDHKDIATIGFCQNAKTYSHPSGKRELRVPPDCVIQTTSLPSPTTPGQITETASKFLPKMTDGQPSTLLAQTKKFYNRLPFKPNKDKFMQAARLLFEYGECFWGRNHKPLRNHEVINGCVGQSLKAINVTSSPGPYFKLVHKLQTKETLFRVTSTEGSQYVVRGFNTETKAGAELVEHFNAIDSLVLNGIPVNFIVKDNPKVELLPAVDVIEEGKVRQFYECDLALNMIFKKYMGSVMSTVIDTHTQHAIQVGHNPYLDPTTAYINAPEGFDIICTDLKRQDKTVHPILIRLVWKLMEYLNTGGETVKPAVFDALAETMCRSIHIQDGILYVVEGSNVSGVFGTSFINSIICLFVDMAYYIDCVDHCLYKTCVSLPTFVRDTKYEILGDDTRRVVHPGLKYTMSGLVDKYAEYGLVCVKSKNGDDVQSNFYGDFCSRLYFWDANECVIFPALKQTSIRDLVLWVYPKSKPITAANFQLAMFEASMWDEEFFDAIVQAVKQQLQYLRIPYKAVSFHPYTTHRRHFARYVRGEESSPTLTDVEAVNLVQTKSFPVSQIKMNYVGKFLEHHAKAGTTPESSFTEAFDRSTGKWSYALTTGGITFTGTELRKSDAKNLAYSQAYNHLLDSQTTRNAGISGEWHKHSFRYRIQSDIDGSPRELHVMADDSLVASISTLGCMNKEHLEQVGKRAIEYAAKQMKMYVCFEARQVIAENHLEMNDSDAQARALINFFSS